MLTLIVAALIWDVRSRSCDLWTMEINACAAQCQSVSEKKVWRIQSIAWCKMASRSALDIFELFLRIPRFVAYYLYMVIKYTCSGPIKNKSLYCDPFCCFCYLGSVCFCCRCCCRDDILERAKLKAKKLRLTFDQWLVKLIFGREGGVVERVNDA